MNMKNYLYDKNYEDDEMKQEDIAALTYFEIS